MNTTLVGISPTGRPKPKVKIARPKPPATPRPIPLKRPPIAKQITITANSNQKLKMKILCRDYFYPKQKYAIYSLNKLHTFILYYIIIFKIYK